MRVELLGRDAPEWASFLRDAEHDFYHLPAYVELCAVVEGGEARALLVVDAGRTMLLPLIVRPIPGGGYDATSPYGYPGPLVTGTQDPLFLRDALIAAKPALGFLGIVSVFVRLHPLLNPSPPDGIGTIVEHGDTVVIDLSLSSEELWGQTRHNHRRDINQALRRGYVARIDEAWTHYETFKRLYRATMSRRSASSYYFFDDAYFDSLRSVLGESLSLCVVEFGGAVAAAGLFVETCGIVEYHLSGSDETFAHLGPTKLMIHFVRAWAKNRGNSRLQLGGGVGGAQDSLLQFKLGFSPLRRAFRTLRFVILEREYARLVAARNASLDPAVLAGFFPLYREASAAKIPASPPYQDASGTGGATMRIRRIVPADTGELGELLSRIDTTYFRPHPMTAEGAKRVASVRGQDLYLLGLIGDKPVAYGMLRGWDEGYLVPSLGIGVDRDRVHQGFGRAMMLALHEAARERGATRVRLRVHPDNAAAAALYRSLGYREHGRERGEILMFLDL